MTAIPVTSVVRSQRSRHEDAFYAVMAGQAAHCRIWHFFQIKRRAAPLGSWPSPRQETLSRNATGLQVRRPIKPPMAGGTEREQCVRDLIRRFVNGRTGSVPILPKERDPRLITIRRGGTLTDEHHRLLADWALFAPSTCCICSRIINPVTAGPATLSMSVKPGSAVGAYG